MKRHLHGKYGNPSFVADPALEAAKARELARLTRRHCETTLRSAKRRERRLHRFAF